VTLYFLQVWDFVLAITTLTDFNIVVAHRLRTVIDYDRLIVLDKGQVGVP
jgi:ABC-type transport system involved in Fe-S cluster assembly fused permease/ATPase subunit